jgi:hypothetical protein
MNGELQLGEVVRTWRIVKERGIRGVAKEMDLSSATLSRLERGYEIDARTLLRVVNWLMRHKETAA